ncbi:MAG: hypothetical protein ACRDH7_07515 [Actinomycetota bacterium]
MIFDFAAVVMACVVGWLVRGLWDEVLADDEHFAPYPEPPRVRLVGSRPHLWDWELDG